MIQFGSEEEQSKREVMRAFVKLCAIAIGMIIGVVTIIYLYL